MRLKVRGPFHGPPNRACRKEDIINSSRAVKRYHLLEVCSSLAPLAGVSLCGCVPRRGVVCRECTGYNVYLFVRGNRRSQWGGTYVSETASVQKVHSPWSCTKGKKQLPYYKKTKSFISRMSSWHNSLLLLFLPDQIILSHPQVQGNHDMFRTVWHSLTSQVSNHVGSPEANLSPRRDVTLQGSPARGATQWSWNHPLRAGQRPSKETKVGRGPGR